MSNTFWLDDYLMCDTSQIKNKKRLQQYENSMRFIMEFGDKLNTAMAGLPKLKDAPDTISERVVLQSLIFHANVLWFRTKDDDKNLYALPAVPQGGWNLNGDFLSAYPYSKNGSINEQIPLFVKGSDESELIKKGVLPQVGESPRGVLMWDNKERIPFGITLEYYAKTGADVLRTIDIARVWMKRPFIPICEDQAKSSVEEIMKKIINNDDLIPLSAPASQHIDAFDFKDIVGMNENVNDCMAMYEWYNQQFTGRCLIESQTQLDKKGENLTTDEIHANDTLITVKREEKKKYWDEQLEYVNECFGTQMYWEWPENGEGDFEYVNESSESDDRDDV